MQIKWIAKRGAGDETWEVVVDGGVIAIPPAGQAAHEIGRGVRVEVTRDGSALPELEWRRRVEVRASGATVLDEEELGGRIGNYSFSTHVSSRLKMLSASIRHGSDIVRELQRLGVRDLVHRIVLQNDAIRLRPGESAGERSAASVLQALRALPQCDRSTAEWIVGGRSLTI